MDSTSDIIETTPRSLTDLVKQVPKKWRLSIPPLTSEEKRYLEKWVAEAEYAVVQLMEYTGRTPDEVPIADERKLRIPAYEYNSLRESLEMILSKTGRKRLYKTPSHLPPVNMWFQQNVAILWDGILIYRMMVLGLKAFERQRAGQTPYTVLGYVEFKKTSGFSELQDQVLRTVMAKWDNRRTSEQLSISQGIHEITFHGVWQTVQDIKTLFRNAAHTARLATRTGIPLDLSPQASLGRFLLQAGFDGSVPPSGSQYIHNVIRPSPRKSLYFPSRR